MTVTFYWTKIWNPTLMLRFVERTTVHGTGSRSIKTLQQQWFDGQSTYEWRDVPTED